MWVAELVGISSFEALSEERSGSAPLRHKDCSRCRCWLAVGFAVIDVIVIAVDVFVSLLVFVICSGGVAAALFTLLLAPLLSALLFSCGMKG